ncbi:Lysophospholipase L1 [Carnobacterium iners]|uniref:Lysophospholipase L1 n=1 Tax=Carnobacterium iners TaxID=1073423 RepID=A0A1X7MQ07_9LACT|nr:GDSL-type esterase/lipase family protein [Carnobacterium iners]SEK93771.1 Lysophospholipase L1 [Carnobacterium iners]SMH26714.1 Lysophospholipase L1 [Carnobacterium iners]
MFKKVIWPLILVSSLALSIIFIGGFVASVNVSKSEEENQTEKPMESMQSLPEESDEIPTDSSEILILGDSIGFGIGDEEELGIGGRYLDLIAKEGQEKKAVKNSSIPGYESADLVKSIKSGENNASILGANLIILSIGGNDLNRLEYEDSVTLTLAFEEALKSYKENLAAITKEIRTINPDAQLAFIGLYNPYSEEEPEKAIFLLEWNYETRVIVNSDVKFAYIPTYELFEYHLDDYLSIDEFHPSGLGYQVIAEVLNKIINK